jgi:hypothetical protein
MSTKTSLGGDRALSPASMNGAKFSIAQIPTLRDVSKDVVRAEESIGRMLAQRAQLEAERHALLREAVDDNQMAKRRKARDDAMVATMFGTPTTGPGELRDDLALVIEKTRVLDSALSLARKQLDAANREASALVCQQVCDLHESLAHEVVSSVLALHRACVAYEDFGAAMNSRNIAWGSLRPVFPRFIGHPRDPYSPVAIYLRDIMYTETGAPCRLDELPIEFQCEP